MAHPDRLSGKEQRALYEKGAKLNVEKVKEIHGIQDFITAKEWREMDTEDIIKSVEIATKVIEDGIKGEWLGEATEISRTAQLLDIAAKFQELAMEVLKGIAEEKGQV